MRIYILLVAGFCLIGGKSFSQVQYKDVHLSVVPGLGSSGLDPGSISTHLSLNLLTGYIHSLHGVELSGIASLNSNHTQGIQISGLFNTTGTNMYALKDRQEIRDMYKNGESADLVGFQMAGLLNFVRGNSTGAQVSAGANSTRSLIGVQLTGFVNKSERYVLGGQLGLLANISNGPTEGFQAGIGLNKTKNDLEGGQFGLINLAGSIEGTNSIFTDKPTAVQLGLINRAGKNNGFQIGLINIAGEMRGTQIGLINIYNTPLKTGQKNGTAIGLLNFGQYMRLKFFYDETFQLNAGLGSGVPKNDGLMGRATNQYLVNYALYRQGQMHNTQTRGYGYGFEKTYFNVELGPNNDFRFIGMGLYATYVDFLAKSGGYNGLMELVVTAGTRVTNKVRSLYLTAAIDGNYHFGNNGETLGPEKLNTRRVNEESVQEIWPGFRLGITVQ